MIYFLKKIVGAIAGPLAIALFFVAAASLMRVLGRSRGSAWLFLLAGTTAYLGAIVPVGDAMLGPLENRYPPLTMNARVQVKHIVVLGSGYAPRNSIPVSGAIDPDGLVRIVEGIRLAKAFKGAQLILSGGAPEGRVPSAYGYAELARQLGVEESLMVVLDSPLDTASEAAAVFALLGDEEFILVTSAYHMPRAMRLMESVGAKPVAAPTGHRVDETSSWTRQLLPSSAGLRKTEQALHEYLGLMLTIQVLP